MPMRTPLFQRKSGGPAVVVTIGHHPGGADAGADPGDPSVSGPGDSAGADAGGGGDGGDSSGDCTCPQCGCVFNPDTGEVAPGQGSSESSGAPDQGTPPPDAGSPADAAPAGGLSDALMQQLKGGAS